MRVIFLDVDGVLITWRSHFAFTPKPEDDRFSSGLMNKHDPVAAAFLEKFCRIYNYKIVVSSTWRANPELCFKLLACCNLKEFLHEDWRTIQSGDKRGIQIQEWLDRHPEVGINDYLIIDDDSDILLIQMENFIHTNMWDGISGKDMNKMIEKGLNRKQLIV